MAVWPVALPKPVYPDIREGAPIGAVLATPTDVGPGKRRLRSTATVTPFSLVFAPVTEAMLEDFSSFFTATLGMSVLSFDMDHPITGTSQTWRFSAEDAYNISPIGDDAYQIEVALELLS